MKTLGTILSLLLLGSPALAQGVDNVANSIVYLKTDTIETIEINGRRFEVWLRDPTNGKAVPKIRSAIGTGFLVKRGSRTFLVTAQHVMASFTAQTTATIRLQDKGGRDVPLSKLIVGSWKKHGNADVAGAEVTPSTGDIDVSSAAFPYQWIQQEPVTPSRSMRLTVLGFPLSLGIGKTVSPISRETMAASGPLDLPRFDNRVVSTFFLLQDPSVGGFSGAPVFDLHLPNLESGGIAFRSKGVTCYGLIHGTISDDTGGKFAAVVPSAFIKQLIDEQFP